MKLLRALAIGICGSATAAAWSEPLPTCSSPPFAEETEAPHEQWRVPVCGGERFSWKFETPRAPPFDTGPGLLKASFSSVVTRTVDDWRSTPQTDWTSAGSGSLNSLRAGRAALGSASLLQLEDWTLRLKLGRGTDGAPGSLATLAGLWQPTRSALVFVEWAGSHTGTQAHRLGARWWPLPGLMAFDFSAQQLPGNTAWVDQRLSLTLQLRH